MDGKDPLTPAVAVGFAVFSAGGIAWLWLGNWRWLVTGVVLLLVVVVASTAWKPRP